MSARWSGSPARGPLAFPALDDASLTGGRAAVFLDRDGTLNELVRDPESGEPESPLARGDVRLIPGAAEALTELADAGYVLVCVTNQPAAAKGKTTLRELLEIHEQVLGELGRRGAKVDSSRLCPHHPDGTPGELTRVCSCRKPAPGMLLGAAADLALDLDASWMVGDTDSDVRAGSSAGCRTVLIEYPDSAHKRAGAAAPEMRVPDLRAAVAQVLAQSGR